jgi:hypothetical protein
MGYGDGYKYNPAYIGPVKQEYLPIGSRTREFFDYRPTLRDTTNQSKSSKNIKQLNDFIWYIDDVRYLKILILALPGMKYSNFEVTKNMVKIRLHTTSPSRKLLNQIDETDLEIQNSSNVSTYTIESAQNMENCKLTTNELDNFEDWGRNSWLILLFEQK